MSDARSRIHAASRSSRLRARLGGALLGTGLVACLLPVAASQVKVWTDRRAYAPGEAVTVHFSHLPQNAWHMLVCLAPKNAPHSPTQPQAWIKKGQTRHVFSTGVSTSGPHEARIFWQAGWFSTLDLRVRSAFEVVSGPQQPGQPQQPGLAFLSTSQRAYQVGETIDVTLRNLPPGRHLVTLREKHLQDFGNVFDYAIGPGERILRFRNGLQGTGSYEARLYLEAGGAYSLVEFRYPFRVQRGPRQPPSPGPTLPASIVTERPVYAVGEPINVFVSRLPAGRHLVTVRESHCADYDYGRVLRNAGPGRSLIPFARGVRSPGSYEARLYLQDQWGNYTLFKRYPFQVGAVAPPQAVVTLRGPSEYAPGQPVVADYSNLPPGTHHIFMCRQGALDSVRGWGRAAITGPAGTHTFPAPGSPGPYEVRIRQGAAQNWVLCRHGFDVILRAPVVTGPITGRLKDPVLQNRNNDIVVTVQGRLQNCRSRHVQLIVHFEFKGLSTLGQWTSLTCHPHERVYRDRAGNVAVYHDFNPVTLDPFPINIALHIPKSKLNIPHGQIFPFPYKLKATARILDMPSAQVAVKSGRSDSFDLFW